MNLQSTIDVLKSTATLTPEFSPEIAEAANQKALSSLVIEYAELRKFLSYLEFLKLTGGAHIHNQEFSLGIYGFGGYVVTSFDEGLFVDGNRYFRFAEVLYKRNPEPVYVFAFDLQAESDLVLTSPIEQSDYVLCAPTFLALLNSFARGVYPNGPL